MSTTDYRRTILTLVLLAASFAGMDVDGQVQNAAPVTPGEKDEQVRRTDEMERLIRDVQIIQDGAEVKIVDKPILRFDDPARAFYDGTLWAYGTSGRPVALGSLERYESFWSYYFVALSDAPITAKYAGGVSWNPRVPSLDWIRLHDVPLPAESSVRRMTYMKQLMRRLALSEQGTGGDRYELRLMPTHIYRYSDPKTHIKDGAIFVFSYGRNPEAVALVEYRQDDSPRPEWFISFAPQSTAALTAKLDDREIWNQPIVPPTARTIRDKYITFTRGIAIRRPPRQT